MTPNPFRDLVLFPAPAVALFLLTASLSAQTSLRPTSTNASSSSSTQRSTSSNSNSSNSSGVRQYNSNTLLGNATIQIDPETRSVVVVTDEDTNVEIARVISNLDRPKPQVLIKVVFVEVDLDKSSDVGIDGSYTFKVGGGSTSSSGSTTSTTTQSTGAPGGNTTTTTTTVNPAGINSSAAMLKQLYSLSPYGGLLTLTNGNWAATLSALNTHNNVHVLSRPSIMARNNQQAVIVVGQEVPMITNSQITDTGQTNNTVSYQDVGIILRVTPFISANKTVEMIVAPEISSLDAQSVQVSTNVNAPIIDKRAAETVVVTPNATTIVIGGLMQKSKTSTVQKIPLLGDIPYLGAAFRHTTKDEFRNELLIFLTPYIVENPEVLKGITRDTAIQADLQNEPMYKDELQRKSLDLNMQLPTAEEAKAVNIPPTIPPAQPKATPSAKPKPKGSPTPKPKKQPKEEPDDN